MAAGHRVIAASRSPGRVPAAEGLEVVGADFDDVDSLVRAYQHVDAVVVHLHAGAPPDAALPQARAVLDALSQARVKRVVFNASGAIWDRPLGVPFLDARRLLATELPTRVRHATVVGPLAAYMENLSARWVADRVQARGELAQPVPADAPVPWVALADIASAMADALAAREPPARVVLRGPGAPTGREVAAAIGEVLGCALRWVEIPFAEHLNSVAAHLGPDYAKAMAAVYGPHAVVPPPPALPNSAVRQGSTTIQDWSARQYARSAPVNTTQVEPGMRTVDIDEHIG
jgi:uncharacterized protein YbjT (DUF2867 family)